VISELLGNETTEVIVSGKDPETALKDMDAGVRKIMEDSGYYQ
jgi:hypothetical protein